MGRGAVALTVRLRMYRKTFCVCWGPLMMSGKQAASCDVMRSWGRRLWKAAPSTPGGGQLHPTTLLNAVTDGQYDFTMARGVRS